MDPNCGLIFLRTPICGYFCKGTHQGLFCMDNNEGLF